MIQMEEKMGNSYTMKIDAYSHISPPKFTEAMKKLSSKYYGGNVRPLFDMEERFRLMDMYPEVVQVLTIGPVPPLEALADPTQAVDLAKLANDEMAELTRKYRDRFVAAIALLPMNNVEAALKETDRAIKDLGFRGIYVHSNINGKPLDSLEFWPLWEKMANYDLPIYIHPWRKDEFADYETEKESKYMVANVFGWPYETTVAMTRFIFSGILDKYPKLKIVTHHGGGMVPYYEERIYQHYGRQIIGSGPRNEYVRKLSKTPLEYYKMFYNDTAIHGNTPALMLAYNFWGADHILFGADYPLGDYYYGLRSYRNTIGAIEAMGITEPEKKKIFVDNIINLLRIPL